MFLGKKYTSIQTLFSKLRVVAVKWLASLAIRLAVLGSDPSPKIPPTKAQGVPRVDRFHCVNYSSKALYNTFLLFFCYSKIVIFCPTVIFIEKVRQYFQKMTIRYNMFRESKRKMDWIKTKFFGKFAKNDQYSNMWPVGKVCCYLEFLLIFDIILLCYLLVVLCLILPFPEAIVLVLTRSTVLGTKTRFTVCFQTAGRYGALRRFCRATIVLAWTQITAGHYGTQRRAFRATIVLALILSTVGKHYNRSLKRTFCRSPLRRLPGCGVTFYCSYLASSVTPLSALKLRPEAVGFPRPQFSRCISSGI